MDPKAIEAALAAIEEQIATIRSVINGTQEAEGAGAMVTPEKPAGNELKQFMGA
jgi:hypothetical protein